MKLVLLYDKIDEHTGIPKINGNSSFDSYLYQELTTKKIPILVRSFDKINLDVTNHVYFYVFELYRIHYKNMFNNLDAEKISIIQKNKIPIILYLPSEGFDCNTNYWLDWILMKIKQYNLSNHPMYLVSGNLKIEDDYREYAKDLPDSLKFRKVFPLSYFEWRLESFCQYRQVPEINPMEVLESFRNNKLNFLSYNANFRSNRIAFVMEILRRNLQKESLFSFIGGKDLDFLTGAEMSKEFLNFSGREFLSNYMENKFRPMIIDYNDQEKRNHVYDINRDHYLGTWFSLVSETEVSKDTIFLTEKTFKPIKALHPFIIWGSPYTLKKLRSMGYQTFPELFNESYDEEENSRKRLSMLMDEVERFINIPNEKKIELMKQIMPKLISNKANLYRRGMSKHSEIRHITRKLINGILK